MKKKKNKNPVFIPSETYEKIVRLTKAGLPDELSLIGEVEIIEGVITVTKVFVPIQSRSGAETEFEAGWLSYVEQQGADTEKLKCWIHSHPKFSTSPSDTDETEWDNMIKEKDFFIMLIVSLSYEWYCRVLMNGYEFECTVVTSEEEEDLTEEKKLIDDATIVKYSRASSYYSRYTKDNNHAFYTKHVNKHGYLLEEEEEDEKKAYPILSEFCDQYADNCIDSYGRYCRGCPCEDDAKTSLSDFCGEELIQEIFQFCEIPDKQCFHKNCLECIHGLKLLKETGIIGNSFKEVKNELVKTQ